ncbi:hypothetical protein ZHAS_00000568 [Anopheles sinensis]|uniref:Uncharacterized protein n=1 Tax=Anopheles sinensis TaxID=74873 RepID=A0A084VA92_ANOSI|nr:hypothetical protein ZHAS_00000568 [Anopheles sinensis]
MACVEFEITERELRISSNAQLPDGLGCCAHQTDQVNPKSDDDSREQQLTS